MPSEDFLPLGEVEDINNYSRRRVNGETLSTVDTGWRGGLF